MLDVWRPLARMGVLAAVVGLGLAAAWPIVAQGLPSSADGAFHVYRLLALDKALGQGIYFPRVVPDLLYGYGYPLFNFYPPLSSYVGEAFHLLGLGYVDAVRAGYALAIILSGLAMFTYARSLHSGADGRPADWPGLVAAACYVFNPYLLITVYTRGALAEALSFPLAPLLLWQVRRGARGGDRGALVGVAVTAAVMVLMHSGLAALMLPAAAAYGLLCRLSIRAPGGRRWRASAELLAALGLGLGLSAFFWLPAALERDYVTWSNLTSGWYDFRQHFLAPAELLSTAVPYPLTNPHPIPPRLGWLTAVLAVGGLVVSLAHVRDGRRWELPALFILGLVALTGMLPVASPVWERAPLLPMLSFPWRLFALVAVAWAPLAGGLVPASGRLAAGFGVVLIAGVGAYVLPGLTPATMELDERQVTLERQWMREYQGSMVGTTSANEYLPIWVKDGAWGLPRVPDEAYRDTDDTPALPAEVVLRRYSPADIELEVRAKKPTPLTLHTVFFPGWRALLDGRELPVQSSTGRGLVSVEVPAGEHRLRLQFDDTRTRQAAVVTSLVCLVILLAFLLWTGGRRRGYVAAAGVVALVAIELTGYSGYTATVRPINVRASEELDLLAARFQPVADAPEPQLNATLYWLFRGGGTDNQVARFSLLEGDVEVVSWERLVGGPFAPTRRWTPGEIVVDRFALELPPDLASDSYRLVASLHEGGPPVSLGALDLSSVPRSERPVAARRAHVPAAVFGGELELLDFGVENDCCQSTGSVRPGDRLRVILRWQAQRVLARNYTVFVHLVDATGRRLAQHDGEPDEDRWPTMLWTPARPVVDAHELVVDPAAAPGPYQLRAGVYFRPRMERLSATSTARPIDQDAVVLIEGRIEE